MKQKGAQDKAQYDMLKENKQAEADMISQKNKDQNEAALAAQEHEYKKEIAYMEFQLKEREMNQKLHHNNVEMLIKARAEGQSIPGLEDMIKNGTSAPTPAAAADYHRPRVKQVVRYPQGHPLAGFVDKIVDQSVH